MKERIEKILSFYKISSAHFAETINVQRSSISHIISGRNKPSYDFIVKILHHYNEINAEWLLTGKGNMLKSTISGSSVSENRDLFHNVTQNHPKQLIDSDINEVKTSPELDNIKDKIQETKQEVKDNTSKITNVNNVKHIIFIYQDDSFKIINKH